MTDGTLTEPWKNAQCGKCKFFTDVPRQGPYVAGQPKIKECRESPPVPLLSPVQTKGGMQMQLSALYPRMPENYPACGRFKKVFDMADLPVKN